MNKKLIGTIFAGVLASGMIWGAPVANAGGPCGPYGPGVTSTPTQAQACANCTQAASAIPFDPAVSTQLHSQQVQAALAACNYDGQMHYAVCQQSGTC
jgi:hypothetical protein